MTHARRLIPLFLLSLALAACGGEKNPTGGTEDADHDAHDERSHDHAAPHGGELVVSSDHAMHFEIAHDAEAGLVKLWIYDGDVKPVSTSAVPVINIPLADGPVQVKGQAADGAASATEWHFQHTALTGHVHGARLRVLALDRTYTVDFPDEHGHDEHDHDGDHDQDGDHDHGHDHEGEGPHHGIVQPFTDGEGKTAGYVELKLHGDAGDLELWIAKDEAMQRPFDLPLSARVTLMFTSMGNRKVLLQVRNEDENEDEDGVANNRDGNTNYFIHPGDTGADVAWLKGETFTATVAVAFQSGATAFNTKAFELKPHAH